MRILAFDSDYIRNEGVGDYKDIQGIEVFVIKKLSNPDYQKLILLHELVEKMLVDKAGISEEIINQWDADHLEADEPGELKECPYRHQHLMAEKIERMVAQEMGIDFVEYEKFLINLVK